MINTVMRESAEDDGAHISLIPGTSFTVTSGYHNVEINTLSKTILRLALLICMSHVIIIVTIFAIIIAENPSGEVAWRLIDILFSVCLFYLAYSGVTMRNTPFLCGITHLGAYYFILLVYLFMELVRFVNFVYIWVHRTDRFISVLVSFYFIVLELWSLHYILILRRILRNEQVASATTTTTDLQRRRAEEYGAGHENL